MKRRLLFLILLEVLRCECPDPRCKLDQWIERLARQRQGHLGLLQPSPIALGASDARVDLTAMTLIGYRPGCFNRFG